VAFALLACRKDSSRTEGASIASAGEAQEHIAARRDGCVERRQSIGADEILPYYGFSAANLFLLPEGPEQALLTWESGEQTTVRFTMGPGSLFFVKSEGDPALDGGWAAYCRDHVLLRGPAHLWTDDGRLDERWPAAQLRTFLGRAELTLQVDRRPIRGTYPTESSPSICSVDLQLELLFTREGMSGFSRSVAHAACDAIGPMTGAAWMPVGRWGSIPEIVEPRTWTYPLGDRSSPALSSRRPPRSAGPPAHPR
jgi:hypothetical protein